MMMMVMMVMMRMRMRIRMMAAVVVGEVSSCIIPRSLYSADKYALHAQDCYHDGVKTETHAGRVSNGYMVTHDGSVKVEPGSNRTSFDVGSNIC